MKGSFLSYGYKGHYYQARILKVMLKVRKLGKIECRGKTGFAWEMVLQGNLFLVKLAKTFIIILVVKQVT